MESPTTWIDAVGWPHEVAHTAVLHALLLDPRYATRVAQSLCDLPATPHASIAGTITDVRAVRREPKMPGAEHGKVDLAFDYSRDDQEVEPMAVETKVDSAGSHDQLRNRLAAGGDGILLALGEAAFRLTRFDIEHVNRQSGQRWRRADVVVWAGILNSILDDAAPPFLAEYLGRAKHQAEMHRLAVERAERGEPPRPGGLKNFDDCAWLAATREAMDDRSCDWRLEHWIGGEVMHNAHAGRWHASGADLYVQFTCLPDGRRKLTIRIGSATADKIRATRDDSRLREAATAAAGMVTVSRAVARGSKSAAIFEIGMTGVTPADAAGRCERACGVLDAEGVAALDRAG